MRARRGAAPGPRDRDLSEAQGISEAALVGACCGRAVARINADPDIVMGGAQELGEVMALTRHISCVHEELGIDDRYDPGAHGAMILTEEIDLRIFPGQWHRAFLVERAGQAGPRSSLQVCDAAGSAAHNIILRAGSNHAVFSGLVRDTTSTYPAAARGTTGRRLHAAFVYGRCAVLRAGPDCVGVEGRAAGGGRHSVRDWVPVRSLCWPVRPPARMADAVGDHLVVVVAVLGGCANTLVLYRVFTRRGRTSLAAITSAAVAVLGGIGFIGVVVPHLLRLASGPDHRLLLINAALLCALRLVPANEVAQAGAGVPAVMHDLNLTGLFADRVVVRAAGQVPTAGLPQQVISDEALSRAYRCALRARDGAAGYNPAALVRFTRNRSLRR